MCMYVEEDLIETLMVAEDNPLYGYKYLRRWTSLLDKKSWMSPHQLMVWNENTRVEAIGGPCFKAWVDGEKKQSYLGIYVYKYLEQAKKMQDRDEDVKRIAVWGKVMSFSMERKGYIHDDGYLARYAMIVEDDETAADVLFPGIGGWD